jgi:hypothetical protein
MYSGRSGGDDNGGDDNGGDGGDRGDNIRYRISNRLRFRWPREWRVEHRERSDDVQGPACSWRGRR